MRFIFLIAILSCCSSHTFAKLGIGGGISAGASYSVNKQTHHQAIIMGTGLELCYIPRENNSVFYPSVTFYVTNIEIPASFPLFDNVIMLGTSKNFALNLNYSLLSNSDKFILYGGIGISHIIPDASTIISRGNNSPIAFSLESDNDSYIHPAINLGFRYRNRITKQYPLYIALDGLLRYVHFIDGSEYTISNSASTYNAKISGKLITPTLLITLHYIFEKNQG